ILRAYNNFVDVAFTAGQLDEGAQVALDALGDKSGLAAIRLGGAGTNAVEALIVRARWDDAVRLNAELAGKASAACIGDTLNTAVLALRRGDVDFAVTEVDRRMGIGLQSRVARETVLAEIALEQDRPADALAAVDRLLAALAGSDFGIEFLQGNAFALRAL